MGDCERVAVDESDGEPEPEREADSEDEYEPIADGDAVRESEPLADAAGLLDTETLRVGVTERDEEAVADFVVLGDTVRDDVTEAAAVALTLVLELAEPVAVRLVVNVGATDADALTDDDADVELEEVRELLVDGDVPGFEEEAEETRT